MPLSLDGTDWPAICVDVTCDTCGTLLNSEAVRPAVLANYASIAWYWRDRIMAHLEACPGRPKPRGDA